MIVGLLTAIAIVVLIAGVAFLIEWVQGMRRRIAELDAAR